MMTVAQMAADAGISPDLIRAHCRAGNIEGAMNVGTGGRSHWRAPAAGWEEFKARVTAQQEQERRKVSSRVRDRSSRNLLGI